MKKINLNKALFAALVTIAPLVIIYSQIQDYDEPEFPTAPSAKWSAEDFNAYEENTRERIQSSAGPEDYANGEYYKIQHELDSIHAQQNKEPAHTQERHDLDIREHMLSVRCSELADSLLNAYVENHPDIRHIKQVRADKAKYAYQMDSLSKIPYGTRFVSNLKKIKADMFSKTK